MTNEKLVEKPVRYRREMSGTLLQEFDESKVKNHWRRNKKATVDLLELPVAVDRQLEDQKVTMEYNRNPRLHVPTKVDKVRSEQIIAKKGNTRDVTIKAKAVNKIVREASGVHSYVIVPPPKMPGDVIEPDPDPETNPLVALYAKETKKKPVIVSYGHRPRSASRVFNPGTMRIKMKHDEVAKAPKDHNKFDFGLPVGVLGKILRAPSIKAPGSTVDDDDSHAQGLRSDTIDDQESAHQYDPHDLFSLPPDSPGAQSIGDRSFGGKRSSQNAKSALNQGHLDHGASWISGGGSRGGSVSSKVRKKTSIFTEKLSPMKESVDPIDRPAWDAAHNVIPPTVRQAEIYRLKANHMNDQQLTLKERLLRYNAKTMADELTPYCAEKQQNDFTLLKSGSNARDVQKSSAYYNYGLMALSDPLNGQLIKVKKKYVKLRSEVDAKHKANDFQRSIQEIPKVAYHPASLLTQMQTGAVTLKQIGRIAKARPQWWEKDDFFESPEKDQSSVDSGTSQGGASPSLESGASQTTGSYLYAGSPAVKYDVRGNKLPEAKLYDAMMRAKYGDQRALFDTLMADQDHRALPVQDMDSQIESVGSHFATNMQSHAIALAEVADAVDATPPHLAVESETEEAPLLGLEHDIAGGNFFEGVAVEDFESLSLNADEGQPAKGKNLDEESDRHEKGSTVHNADEDAEKNEPQPQPGPEEQTRLRPELHLTIKSASDLSPANMFGGSSDPYCSVWDEAGGVSKKDEIFKTKYIDNTLEPAWGEPAGSGETFVFPLEELRPKSSGVEEEYQDKGKFKAYRLEVHDYNKMTRGVFLGAVVVTPEHYYCREGEERVEEYEWPLTTHSVKSDKENKLAKGTLRFSTKFVYREYIK